MRVIKLNALLNWWEWEGADMIIKPKPKLILSVCFLIRVWIWAISLYGVMLCEGTIKVVSSGRCQF